MFTRFYRALCPHTHDIREMNEAGSPQLVCERCRRVVPVIRRTAADVARMRERFPAPAPRRAVAR